MRNLILLIPAHSSSLNDVISTYHFVTVIQCLGEGVAWRGLCPLLLESSRSTAKRAAQILLTAYGISELNATSENGITKMLLDDEDGRRWKRRIIRNVPADGEKNGKGNMFLLVLPPHFTPKGLYAERIFTSALVRLENNLIQMQSLAAFLATLGGGYFLCRYLGIAVNLARQQRAVALAMGDYESADRCTINEAYNYIYAGFFQKALSILKKVRLIALERRDEVTVKSCDSAKLFCRRVRKVAKCDQDLLECANDRQGTSQKRIKQATVDDYQRIRVVGSLSRQK